MRFAFLRASGGLVSKTQKIAFSLACGVTVLIASPSETSLQDMQSLMAGGEAAHGQRWQTHMTRSGAGSIHSAEAQFAVDPTVTGSINSAPGARPVSVSAQKSVAPDTPDEDRINRSAKTGRVAAVVPTAPPKAFSAGSVLHRESFLLRPAIADGDAMVFAQADTGLNDEGIEIATAFHKRKLQAVKSNVSPMIADLVNNPVPDILATAYAPPAPDFAKESPFASLLKEDRPKTGRFIPPIRSNDYSWADDPLPAHVFSKKEQECLAIGIYFEARGEVKLGQAAVAQVILNRVRAPTFPNTVCGVVYHNSHWRNRCQFSFTCDGIPERVRSRHHWKLAQEIALGVTAGKIWLKDVGSSTHYHATYVSPRWARAMERVSKIGLHIFYRTSDGGWG
ncbi:MAG: cell wall hydrolase [Pseudomonadota bacterium]